MEQLVIRLGSRQEDPVQWLVWSSEQNEIIASGELDNASSLSSLTERAGSRAITAMVPTGDVVLKQITLPGKPNRKLLSAIPYMLEDELSEDVDNLFFAFGTSEGNTQDIAISSRENIIEWLDWINQAGLTCQKLLPDVLAVPAKPEQWCVMQLGDGLLVRQSEWQGIHGEASWIFEALAHHCKHQEEAVQIEQLSEVSYPAIANTEVTEDLSQLPMEVLARGAINQQFNLLQGEFKPKKQSTGETKKWRLAAALAGVALLTGVVDKGVQVAQLSAEQEQLSKDIESEFRRAFPNTRRIVNVRAQMNQKLNALQQEGSGISVLTMLSQLSEAFSTSNVVPQTIRFDKNRSELRMQASASNFNELEQFKSLAEARGFSVQQGAINNRDNRVVGSLIIKS